MSEEDNWGDYLEDSEDEDDSQSDDEVELENVFYEAEDCKNEDFKKAIEQYQLVILMEETREEKKWTPKSIIEIIKLKVQHQQFEDFQLDFRKMLRHMVSMTNFEQRSTVDNILTSIIKVGNSSIQKQVLETMIQYLKEKDMQDLWLSTIKRLAKIYLNSEEQDKFLEVIQQIKDSDQYVRAQRSKQGGELKTSTLIIDVFSLEIQFYLNSGDLETIRGLCEEINVGEGGDVYGNDPKVQGCLNEAEGKLLLENLDFVGAEQKFKKAFQNYYESGNERSISMLKYSSLTNILSGNEIGPFVLTEAQIFIQDSRIKPFKDLWDAYSERKHEDFLEILGREDSLLSDKFSDILVPELRRKIIQSFISEVLKCYKSLSLKYLAEELNLDLFELTTYLSEMINLGIINAHIDEVDSMVDNLDIGNGREQEMELESLGNLMNLLTNAEQLY